MIEQDKNGDFTKEDRPYVVDTVDVVDGSLLLSGKVSRARDAARVSEIIPPDEYVVGGVALELDSGWRDSPQSRHDVGYHVSIRVVGLKASDDANVTLGRLKDLWAPTSMSLIWKRLSWGVYQFTSMVDSGD